MTRAAFPSTSNRGVDSQRRSSASEEEEAQQPPQQGGMTGRARSKATGERVQPPHHAQRRPLVNSTHPPPPPPPSHRNRTTVEPYAEDDDAYPALLHVAAAGSAFPQQRRRRTSFGSYEWEDSVEPSSEDGGVGGGAQAQASFDHQRSQIGSRAGRTVNHKPATHRVEEDAAVASARARFAGFAGPGAGSGVRSAGLSAKE